MALAAVPLFFVAVVVLFDTTVSAMQHQDVGLHLLEAVEITLANQPKIKMDEKYVETQGGKWQEARGRFDLALDMFVSHQHEDIPQSTLDQLLQAEQTDDLTQYGAGLSKQYRTGVSLHPRVLVERNYTSNPHYPTTNRTRAEFQVTVPLLKGLGREATGAREMAAAKNYSTSLLQLRHTTSRAVLQTVIAYWRYLAAEKSLAVLKHAESRAIEFTDELKRLIAANERPAADLDQMLADISQKSAERIAGQQSLVEARQQLGIALGIPFEQILDLAPPADPFPSLSGFQASGLSRNEQKWTALALQSRSDYLALLEQQKSQEILLKAARNNLLPQLDLNLNVAYSGLKEGNSFSANLESFANDVPGMSVGVALNYHWPPTNNTARGILRQVLAEYDRISISSNDLARTIRSGVHVAVSGLEKSAQQLRQTQEAVRAYQTTVAHEKIKFKLGVSTLLDLITLENQLRDAELREIDAALQYAAQLVILRYETGTLLVGGGKDVGVDESTLLTAPAAARR